MPKQLDPDEIEAEITRQARKMGMDGFYDDYPQSWAERFFGPKSLAYQHWIEGWEIAQLEAYCAMMAEKAKWIAEQEKRDEFCLLQRTRSR